MHQLIGTSDSYHETNPVKTDIIRERVVKSYENVWNDRLDHEMAKDRGGKLGSYRKIKMKLQYEEYLDTVKNGQHRKALSKLRTSSHRLRIETGRYTSPKTDREDKVCVKCHALGYSHVDDEMYFLLDCKFLGYDQKLLLDVANLKYKNFSNLSQEEKYFYMVNSGGEMCRVVAKFCFECFRKKEMTWMMIDQRCAWWWLAWGLFWMRFVWWWEIAYPVPILLWISDNSTWATLPSVVKIGCVCYGFIV